MLQLSVVKLWGGHRAEGGVGRELYISTAWHGLAWPGLTVQMQSKQRLQVPTDDSAGQLETRSDWSRSRWSRTSDFSIKRWWAFLWLFFFLFSVHRHAKGETGNPFWPPRRPAGRQGRRTHTQSHIGIGNQNVANSTTALKWIGGYCEGWAGGCMRGAAWYMLWHCVCFTVHWIAGQTRCHRLCCTFSLRRGWWCQSSLGIAKVITFNMKRTAAQPQERGYGMSVCVSPSLSPGLYVPA